MFDDLIDKKKKRCCICDKDVVDCTSHELIVCSVDCAKEWILRSRKYGTADSNIIDEFEKSRKGE